MDEDTGSGLTVPIEEMREEHLVDAYTQALNMLQDKYTNYISTAGEDEGSSQNNDNIGDAIERDSDKGQDISDSVIALETCKKLERLVESQSRKISELATEVKILKNWKEHQEMVQAVLVIQRYWRRYKSERTVGSVSVMEKIKELNNEVILIKDFLKTLLEQRMKDGDIRSPVQCASNNTTDFIEDLHVILESGTSLLLTWTEYTSDRTLGFSICINGHQVGMVSNDKTKALLKGLNPTSYYKICLVERTSFSKKRESNPVFVCISQMKSLETQRNNIESLMEENIPTQIEDERQHRDMCHNSNESSQLEEVVSPVDSTSPGEKKELNRTYELEKELVDIRQQIGDVEYNDN